MADRSPRRPWTLRRRLVVTVVVLLAVVSGIVGAVSVYSLNSYLLGRLDTQLTQTVQRAIDVATGSGGGAQGPTPAEWVLNAPGQAQGTLTAVVFNDRVVTAGYLDAAGVIQPITVEQGRALIGMTEDSEAHTVTLGGELGQYRVMVASDSIGAQLVVGVPLADVEGAVARLATVVAVVAILGLGLAAVLATWSVRVALRPLDRVVETATRVSGLQLERGEVELVERVPDADPATEAGRVGAAINRMLDHVASALRAREASESRVRQFVADASHELRTPLASIRGYSELTRRVGGDLPAPVVTAMGRIESESVRMTSLVEDLLLLARLDEGRDLVQGSVDVTRLLMEATSDAQVAGPDHIWRLDLPDEPVTVPGDESRLRQVMANLLANARVHTPAGTVVEVAVRGPAGPDDFVTVTVTDNGPGIDPDVRAQLFERFARGDSARTRATGSTGLGLAIVKAVVQGHHGEVSVDSSPGRTSFIVRLPAAARAAD